MHTLVHTARGAVFAWGHNNLGQLGTGGDGAPGSDGTVAHTVSCGPSQVAIAGAVSSIAAGWCHSAAATSDGGVFTWGWGLYCQLGHDGSTANELTPRRVLQLDVAVAMAPSHCAGHT